jgi:predicted phosphodiesterase
MKIISFSDIHLEFEKDLKAPKTPAADLMILSGDILNLDKPHLLKRFLEPWDKPVLYVPGNHEYYTEVPVDETGDAFEAWAKEHLPNLVFLRDAAYSLDGVNFFGGTMWTDFGGGNETAMAEAVKCMADYELIHTSPGKIIEPRETIAFHEAFKKKLLAWFETPLDGPRVVITHHAPALRPRSQYDGSLLIPAFNSLDMVPVIEKYQPDFWFYGHTHECDRQKIGRTQIWSNQLGYQNRSGLYECESDFDKDGAMVEVGAAARAAVRKAR